MNPKALAQLEAHYMRALGFAVLYDCGLTPEQFAAAHELEQADLHQLRGQLERHGVGV